MVIKRETNKDVKNYNPNSDIKAITSLGTPTILLYMYIIPRRVTP